MTDHATDRPFGVARGVTYDWIVNIVVSALFTMLGCITILFRVLTLWIRKRPIGRDDVAMSLAFISNIGYTVASYDSVRWGSGLRTYEVPPSWIARAMKAVWVVEIMYYFSIFFIKMSLMFLYLRIALGLSNSFYKRTLVLMSVIIAQFTSTVVVEAIQCMPIKKYWDPKTPGHCINITVFFYSTNLFTIVTDLIILALPISTLWHINRPKAHRIGLCAAFLIGAISTIASCVPLYSIRIYTQSSQLLQNTAPINTWSFIEINLGIMCASVPAIKPLFMRDQQRNTSRYDDGIKYHSDGSGQSASQAESQTQRNAEASHTRLASPAPINTQGSSDSRKLRNGKNESSVRGITDEQGDDIPMLSIQLTPGQPYRESTSACAYGPDQMMPGTLDKRQISVTESMSQTY